MRNDPRSPIHRLPLLTAALALLLPAATLAATPAAGSAGFDPAAEWEKFLATAEPSVYDHFSDVIAVFDDEGEVDADRCRDGWGKVAKAAEAIPVGAFMQHAAWRCAEALGDDDAADAYMERFAALARHALQQADDDRGAEPIRVVAGRDIGALLEAAGLELRYEYLDLGVHPGRMVEVVAAHDPDTGRERLFAFDYLDTIVRLQRDEPKAAYPSFRRDYRRALLASNAKTGVPSARDQVALDTAYRLDEGPGRVDAVRAEAVQGGMLSSMTWLETCVEQPFEGCGEGLVDALLTHAEHEEGMYLVLLARAYAEGVGVARDEDAAMRLLDRATGVMGDRAVVEYARLHLSIGERPWTPGLEQRLRKAVDDGHDDAVVLLAMAEVRDLDDGSIPAGTRAALEAAAARGHVGAATFLGGRLYTADKFAEALPLLRRAAEGGNFAAQEYLGTALYGGHGVEVDEAQGRAWWLRAAASGDSDAMLRLGWIEHAKADRVTALEWYRSGAVYGNQQAALEFAGIVADGYGEVAADPAMASRVLADIDLPEARRQLSMLLLAGDGIEADPARARRLLEQDADDPWSQAQLGAGLLAGEFGEVDEAAALRVLQPGLDALQPLVVNAYATHLYYADAGDLAARARAVDFWRRAEAAMKADDDDDGSLRNNFAWALCTGPEFTVPDRAEGQRIAQRMGEVEDLESGAIDTVAACRAATGDFAGASQVQEQAVSERARWTDDAEDLGPMRERLALYAAGKPYVETRDED